MAAPRGGRLAEEDADEVGCLKLCCHVGVLLISVMRDGPCHQERLDGKVPTDRHGIR
jgi:hypothetical protein